MCAAPIMNRKEPQARQRLGVASAVRGLPLVGTGEGAGPDTGVSTVEALRSESPAGWLR